MSKPPTYHDLRAAIVRGDGEETMFPYYMRQRISHPDPGMRLDIDPDYQRGHVWTEAQSAAFVGHKLEGGECPSLTIQRWQDAVPDELVDGKQRLLSVLGFVENQIPAMLSDGHCYMLGDWSEPDQALLRRSIDLILRARIVKCPTRADVLRLYLKLNRGGSIHTDTEIERVRALLADEVSRGR
jgi:hypothetical protein